MAHIGTQLGRVVERKQSEDALRQSEVRFRSIFEGASLGIELVDLDGHLLAWNPAMLDMMGHENEELVESALARINHPANVLISGKRSSALFQSLRAGQRNFFRLDEPLTRKDGSQIWVRLSVSLVRDIDERPQFAIVMLEDITERKVIEADLAELQRRLIEGREAERLHLAQELHDGPVQDLYGLSYQLKALEAAIPNQGELAPVDEMQQILQQVVRTLRSICGDLRPPTLTPFGLEKAIRSHADSFQEAYPKITVHMDLAPDGQELSEQVRLALFRIYQQSLTNIVRHANAAEVWVRFRFDPEQVVLEVEDDGDGFVLPDRWIDLARQGHLGLVGAAERAEAIGGKLEVDSAPGQGTRVKAILPRNHLNNR